jgi:hypothetical protein
MTAKTTFTWCSLHGFQIEDEGGECKLCESLYGDNSKDE